MYHIVLLVLGFVAYSHAVPLVTAGSSLESRALTVQVAFVDDDHTAGITGIKGFNQEADSSAKNSIIKFLTHELMQTKLGFSEEPKVEFTNHFPYNTRMIDSGIQFGFTGGTKCPASSPCIMIAGESMNSQREHHFFGVVYNAHGEVILRGKDDVAVVSFKQPTPPEKFSKQVDSLAKATVKLFFENPEVAKKLDLRTPVVIFDNAFTYETIKEGSLSFRLHSGTGCTLSSPCICQAGIHTSSSTFLGKVVDSGGHILVQVGEPIHGKLFQ